MAVKKFNYHVKFFFKREENEVSLTLSFFLKKIKMKNF